MSDYPGIANLEVMEQAVQYNAFLLELVISAARPGDRVLDFGAGTGFFAERLAAEGFELVCIEPDQRLCTELRRKGLLALPGLADVAPQSMDMVYSLNVLEHIRDDAAALASLRRVLKPAGRLLLYVPAFMVLYSAMDRRVGHIRRYRKRSLADLLNGAGFSVDDIRYADCLGFAASMVMKHFGKKSGELDPGMVRLYDRWVFPISRTLDRAFGKLIGKNLFVRARRRG